MSLGVNVENMYVRRRLSGWEAEQVRDRSK